MIKTQRKSTPYRRLNTTVINVLKLIQLSCQISPKLNFFAKQYNKLEFVYYQRTTYLKVCAKNAFQHTSVFYTTVIKRFLVYYTLPQTVTGNDFGFCRFTFKALPKVILN